jgi:hypothetical protein
MNATLEEPKAKETNPTEAEMFGKVRDKFPTIHGLNRKISFLWRTNDALGNPLPPDGKKAAAIKPDMTEAYYFRINFSHPETHYIIKSLFVMATKSKILDLTKAESPRVDNS